LAVVCSGGLGAGWLGGVGWCCRGRRGGAGSGRRCVAVLCCCGAMSHGSVRLGGREAGRKRPWVMFSAWRDAWRCCCMLLGRWHAISGELD
jgi:hypothetical protein